MMLNYKLTKIALPSNNTPNNIDRQNCPKTKQ